MSMDFDFNKALEDLKAGKPMTGKKGVLGPLIKQLAEAALEGEIEAHLSQEKDPNRRNGHTKKQLKTSSGKIELEIPRDRSGTFEPQFVKKNQTGLSLEIEQKVLALYTWKQLSGHLRPFGRLIWHRAFDRLDQRHH